MNRRNFLKSSLCASMLSGGFGSLVSTAVNAQVVPAFTSYGRTIVNVMLLGGADLRFLFAPDPVKEPEYAAKYWEKRKTLYQYNAANEALYPDYASVFDPNNPTNGLYSQTTDGISGSSIGIHNKAGWLKQQFDLGNVAIVANVSGSENRRHDQSQLIINTGDSQASQYIYDREGWGGRLAYAIGKANAVAVTNDISVFCNGIDSSNRNAKTIHAQNTRDFGLSAGDGDPLSDNSAMARALRTYYAEKQIQAQAAATANWPYQKFLNHEQALRAIGDQFVAKLAMVSPQKPAALAALHTAGSGNNLNSSSFGLQCANVYDSFLGADLFQQRIVSMEYTGWDTHNNEKTRFEANIEDIFGVGKGLDTLSTELSPLGANDDIVYVFNTDFGRQLGANGDFGTDHGRGNYMILVGNSVNGGIYGEMFPGSEIQGAANATKFDQVGSDIMGLTSFERVLSAACDWVEPGTSSQVFPNATASAIEAGVDISNLFSPGGIL